MNSIQRDLEMRKNLSQEEFMFFLCATTEKGFCCRICFKEDEITQQGSRYCKEHLEEIQTQSREV